MRNIIKCCLVIIFLISIMANTQVENSDKSKESNTKLETFLSKKGISFIKENYELGNFPLVTPYLYTIEFKAVIIYEIGQEQQKIRGIMIEITLAGATRPVEPEIAFIDYEELESLSKAIQNMLDLSMKWKNNEKDIEFIYSTKDNFYIGFTQDGNRQSAFAQIGYFGKIIHIFNSMDDLSSVKSAVDKGLSLLKEK